MSTSWVGYPARYLIRVLYFQRLFLSKSRGVLSYAFDILTTAAKGNGLHSNLIKIFYTTKKLCGAVDYTNQKSLLGRGLFFVIFQCHELKYYDLIIGITLMDSDTKIDGDNDISRQKKLV